MWIELRRALAGQCGLPAEALGPDDTLDTLEALTFDGWDFLGLSHDLAEQLHVPVSALVGEHGSTGESAETIRGVGECLARTLRSFVPSGIDRERTSAP